MPKCNVDCALFNNNSFMGYDICFRDLMGQFLFGKSNWAS